MSINLLDTAKEHLTDAALGALANKIGVDPSSIGGIVGKVFPSLLALFGDKASSSGGLSDLFDSVKDADDGILGNLSDVFSGDTQQLQEAGGGLLGSLFGGGGKLDSFTNVLGSIPGLSGGKASGLMTLLVPVITGILGKQVRSGGLGASGLQALLGGQKQHIASALGSDFSQKLGLGSFLGTSGAATSASTATTSTRTTTAAASTSSSAATKTGGTGGGGGGGGLFKLLPFLILGLLAFLLLKFCKRSDSDGSLLDKAADTVSDASGAVVDGAKAAGGAVVDGAQAAGDLAADAGGAIVDGAQAAGGAVVDGAQAAGDLAADAGGAIVDGAQAVGEATAEGAEAAGTALKQSFVPEAAEGEEASPALSDKVRAFAGKLTSIDAADEAALDKVYQDLANDGSSNFLYRIPFATGETGVPSAHQEALIAKLKAADPKATLVTIGYADVRGDDALNKKLSYGRAREVAAWIKSTLGNDSALESFSMGETDRFSKENFSKNRVVEVWQINE